MAVFNEPAFIRYLTLLVLLGAAGAGLGAVAGHWARTQPALSSRRLGGLILLAFVSWLAVSWGARLYAETGRPGWGMAEWWGHTGKWRAFLGGYAFTALLALGYERGGSSTRTRALVGLLALGVVGITIHRTFPVFVLLGRGERDPKGYLLQSRRHEYACAAVALANYLEQYRGQDRLTERDAARLCRTTVEGTTKSAVLEVARQRGLAQAACRKVSFAELAQRRLPVLVSISTLPGVRHASLLVRLDEDSAWFIDPAYGSWRTSLPNFKTIWYGTTITFD